MIKPGYYRGKLFCDYVGTAKQLKRDGRRSEVIELLTNLCETAEEWAVAECINTPPWYHWQLAVEYRKAKDHASEINIIERFLAHRHHPETGAEFTSRMENAIGLRLKGTTSSRIT